MNLKWKLYSIGYNTSSSVLNRVSIVRSSAVSASAYASTHAACQQRPYGGPPKTVPIALESPSEKDQTTA